MTRPGTHPPSAIAGFSAPPLSGSRRRLAGPRRQPEGGEAFARGLLAAAVFALGLAACGEAGDDVTGTVPNDTTIEEVQPVVPAEPVTPVEPAAPAQ